MDSNISRNTKFTAWKTWKVGVMMILIILLFIALFNVPVTQTPINKDYQIYKIWKVYKDGEYFYNIDYIDGKLIKSLEVKVSVTPIYYSTESKMTWNYHTNCNGFCSGSTIIDSVTLYVSDTTQVEGASSEYRSGKRTETTTIEKIV